MHYFAKDGNYGDAGGILILPTDRFTEADWAELSEATDSDRADLAGQIFNERMSVEKD